MIDPDTIPADYEVQPIDPDDPTAESPATCGTCGLTWDDGKVTSMTPVPSGRCPFEAWHLYGEDALYAAQKHDNRFNVHVENSGDDLFDVIVSTDFAQTEGGEVAIITVQADEYGVLKITVLDNEGGQLRDPVAVATIEEDR